VVSVVLLGVITEPGMMLKTEPYPSLVRVRIKPYTTVYTLKTARAFETNAIDNGWRYASTSIEYDNP